MNVKKLVLLITLLFVIEYMFPLYAAACTGCFISPGSGRFNYIGFLFWVSIIYWVVMAVNELVFKLAKKSLPYKAPRISWKILVLCVLLVPFTLWASLIMLTVFSCVLEIVKQISNSLPKMKQSLYMKIFVLYQGFILFVLILIVILKPNLQSIKSMLSV